MKSIELISTLSRMEFPSWTTDTNGALSRSLHQSIEVQSCDNLETEDQGRAQAVFCREECKCKTCCGAEAKEEGGEDRSQESRARTEEVPEKEAAAAWEERLRQLQNAIVQQEVGEGQAVPEGQGEGVQEEAPATREEQTLHLEEQENQVRSSSF